MARQSIPITALPRSPEEDRHARMVKYLITMAIRIVCIGLCLVVQGWWLIVCVVGAVFLPYIAVILANAVDVRGANVERPEERPRMIESSRIDAVDGPDFTDRSDGTAESHVQ